MNASREAVHSDITTYIIPMCANVSDWLTDAGSIRNFVRSYPIHTQYAVSLKQKVRPEISCILRISQHLSIIPRIFLQTMCKFPNLENVHEVLYLEKFHVWKIAIFFVCWFFSLPIIGYCNVVENKLTKWCRGTNIAKTGLYVCILFIEEYEKKNKKVVALRNQNVS